MQDRVWVIEMTTIKHSSYCGCYSIHAEGHATGSKEVCAAITGILYALKGYLLNAEADVKQSDLSEAEAHIVFYGGLEAKSVYQMTVIGLTQIAHSYPQFAKVQEE